MKNNLPPAQTFALSLNAEDVVLGLASYPEPRNFHQNNFTASWLEAWICGCCCLYNLAFVSQNS